MYPCPSCQQRTLGFSAKIWTTVALPVKCRGCGALCFAPGSPGGVLAVFNVVLLTASGFAASAWHTPWPLAAAAVVAVALWLLRLHAQPFLALTPAQAAAALKHEGFWLFVFIVLSLFQ